MGSSCRHSPCGGSSPTRPGVRPRLGTVPAGSGAERRRLTEQGVDHTSARANLSESGTNHPMFHAEPMDDSIPPTQSRNDDYIEPRCTMRIPLFIP